MNPVEGRIALGLDEFMLRMGHLCALSYVATEVNSRPNRLEKDLADYLTRPVSVDAAHNQLVA
jgi:hypothetical protein